MPSKRGSDWGVERDSDECSGLGRWTPGDWLFDADDEGSPQEEAAASAFARRLPAPAIVDVLGEGLSDSALWSNEDVQCSSLMMGIDIFGDRGGYSLWRCFCLSVSGTLASRIASCGRLFLGVDCEALLRQRTLACAGQTVVRQVMVHNEHVR